MKKAKRTRLERAGWKVGTSREFLGLSDGEARFLDLKLALANALRRKREREGLSSAPRSPLSVAPDLDPPDCLGQRFDGWLPSRLIPHRHRPRAELQPTYQLQVQTLR